MQNKKILSVLLSLVLVCTCVIGMLILNVSGEGEGTVKEYALVDNSVKATLAQIKAEIEGGTFEADSAKINLGTAQVAAEIENDLLFGTQTIFLEGKRLPITITGESGAAVTFSAAGDYVACANSYTFENIGFYVADAAATVNFYAGSGNVVLKNVQLSANGTGKNANFYADNCSAYAFAGWGEDEIEAAKNEHGDDLVHTSLTLDTVDYSWSDSKIGYSGVKGTTAAQVNGVGWNAGDFRKHQEVETDVVAKDLAVTLKIVDAKITGVHGRPMNAVSPVASLDLIVEDTSADNSKTVIPQLTGVGNNGENSGGILSGTINFGKFDFTASIKGGAFGGAGGKLSKADGTTAAAASSKNRACFFRNVNYDGDLTVNISGGKFASPVFGGWKDENGTITGTALLNITGGTFGTVYGPASHGENENETPDTIQNLTTITGGNVTTFASCQGAQVPTKVTIGGTAKIGTYYGSWSSGGGGKDAHIPWVINTVEGSAEIDTFYGTGRPSSDYSEYHVDNVLNNMLGGKIMMAFYGTGNQNSIGNVENNFFGITWPATWYNASTKKDVDVVLAGTYTAVNNVTGSVTTNFMRGEQAAAGYFYAVGGGTFNCDVTVNTNVVLNADGSHGVSTSNDSGKHPRLYGATAAAQINGDVHWNLNKIQGTIGQSFLGTNMSVDGNFHVDLIGRSSYFTMSSNLDMGPNTCTGDVNVRLENCKISYAAGKSYNARVLRSDIGGKLNFTAVNSVLSSAEVKDAMNGANRVRLSTVKQVGDVSVTFIGTQVNYDLMDFDVDGTLEIAVKGTNSFTYADGTTGTYPWPSGKVTTLVNRFIDGAVVNGNFYGTGGKVPVEKVINKFYDGATVNGNFYGTGAATVNADGTFTGSPVGKFVTVDEVTTWQPGDVENYIYGGTFNGVFFGTGDQTVNKVTTTMTGGTITGLGDLAEGEYPSVTAPKASSEVVIGLGCYYGNYGLVNESITNNIYSGTIGNNFYGSNNQLTCPVINNIGNNLYNALNPEAPIAEKANLGRTVFSGGEWVGTSATGKSNDVNPCNGYVVINIDGALFGKAAFIAGHVNGANPETGNAVDINIQNATFASRTVLAEYAAKGKTIVNQVKTGEVDGKETYEVIDNVEVPCINGSAYVLVGDRNDTSGAYTVTLSGNNQPFHGFGRSVKGDNTFIASNAKFGQKSSSFSSNLHADGTAMAANLTLDFYHCDFAYNFADIGDHAGNNNSIVGTYKAKFSHCIFNSRGISGNDSVTQVANRRYTNQICEIDSCTINSANMKAAMQASTNSEVYIYGNNVIGSPALQLTRQASTHAYVGVKPGADGALIPVETSFDIKEGGCVYGGATDKPGNASKIDIYDVTVTGSGLFAPFTDADTATAAYDYDSTVKNTLKLVGNLMIPNGENPTVFVNAAEAGASVSPAPGEPWADPSVSDKVYLTAKDASVLANVAGRSFSGSFGYAKKVGNTIVGAEFVPTNECMVNIDIQERLYLNLWIPKENLVTYLESGMLNLAGENAFDVKAVLGGDVPSARDRILGFVSIDQDFVEANTRTHTDGKDYVIVKIGAVAANDFATTIAFEGSEMTVLLGSDDFDLSETTMLTLAENGIEKYAETKKFVDLFTAIYNYGASACGLELKQMNDFAMEDNAADPAPQVGATDQVKFTGMALLMGDAIGIRFKGTLIDANKEDITMTLSVNGGAEQNAAAFSVFDGATEGSVMVDTYVNFGNVTDVLTFTVKVKGETALTVTTSVKGYAEQIASSTDPKAQALAQFAQAIYNATENDLQN